MVRESVTRGGVRASGTLRLWPALVRRGCRRAVCGRLLRRKGDHGPPATGMAGPIVRTVAGARSLAVESDRGAVVRACAHDAKRKSCADAPVLLLRAIARCRQAARSGCTRAEVGQTPDPSAPLPLEGQPRSPGSCDDGAARCAPSG